MHGHETAGADLDKGTTGLLRVHVGVLHEPGWTVGADRNHRDVQVREPAADLAEAVEPGGVSGVVDGGVLDFDHVAAP